MSVINPENSIFYAYFILSYVIVENNSVQFTVTFIVLSFRAEMISGCISGNYSPEHTGFENQQKKKRKRDKTIQRGDNVNRVLAHQIPGIQFGNIAADRKGDAITAVNAPIENGHDEAPLLFRKPV